MDDRGATTGGPPDGGGQQRPIGYWVKHLDALLERQFAQALADASLTRRHWQVLHTLSRGATTRTALTDALAPFWQDEAPDLAAVLDGPAGLAARGWVAPGAAPGTLALTDAGRAAHANAAARVGHGRAVVMQGLTPQQYADTVAVLQAMARNVEAALGEDG